MITKPFERILPAFLFALLFLPLLSGPAHALCVIDRNGTYIEAEDFTGSYNFKASPGSEDEFEVVDVTGANGGVVLVSGENGGPGNTPSNEVKEYEVSFPETGTYQIWMRGRGVDGSQDSMFFAVDDDDRNDNDTW